jgi:methionyl-tRNA formyltransferase
MSKEDGYFDWTVTADVISRRVRGFQPFPTTYTRINDKKLTIWDCSPVDVDTTGEPGTVLSAHGDELVIACGEATAIRISEIQPEGKRRMSVRDFLNGTQIEVGKLLSEQL